MKIGNWFAGIVAFACGFCFIETAVAGLNEWSFNTNVAGLMLSQTANSGTESAVFASGGAGFLETDGNGLLLCDRTASGANETWTGGAVLDADVTDIVSGVHYLRIDCDYDISSTNRISGMAFGLSVVDESGTHVAGMVLGKGNGNAPPGSEIKHVFYLPDSGRMSAILKVNMDAGTLSAWYSIGPDASFNESNPTVSDVPVQLSSIDKLRFRATGDIRPSGSDDYAAADNIRTASTWEEISRPVVLPLSVHALFQDNMILQRDLNVPVWGWITPGEEVTVKLDGVSVGTAIADANGRWETRLGPHAHDGGQPHVLEISSGDQAIQFSDVVFGDVYLASGQSNMEVTMSYDGYGSGGPITGYSTELLTADSFPLIRQVGVSRDASATPLDEPLLKMNWTKCSQSSLGSFTAVGYFFAKKIYQETGVPVGLLFSAWGGMKIERFISLSGMEQVPELSAMRQQQEDGSVTNLYDLYNAMIAPLMPYGIKGAIWYQGEANGYDGGDIYTFKMQALMRGWRQDWGLGDFPFYYVQLANYQNSLDWPAIREAQTFALSETNSGMAVTIDIGNDTDIHPRNKVDVGDRLARWALAKDYGQDVVYCGPLYRTHMVEDSRIRILFDYADGGLIVGQKESTNEVVEVSGPLQNFQIAGADRNFADADAVIDRDTVLVSAAAVNDPVYVRYCWACAPAGSNKLYNASGLPAVPFRTDQSSVLDVQSGSGSAVGVTVGAQQGVVADAPAAGKVFDRWIGAAAEIADPNALSATVTMPEHSLYMLAAYRDTSDSVYTLTVSNGFGSGTSKAGSILNIEAANVAGQEFDHWTGDTQTVENVSAPLTTLRMPSGNVTVTALFHVIDTVGDGVRDDWRAAYFGGDGTATNSQSSADADPDGDGMTNRQEFHAGTSPLDARSCLLLDGNFAETNALLHFSTVGGHAYRLEKSGTLAPPAWETVCYNMTGDGKQKAVLLALDGNSAGFYRLRVSDN